LKPATLFSQKVWILLPLVGSFLFLVLYAIAAHLYPGGSQADADAKGFSWLHNYWCNLLAEKAINGQANGGQFYGYASLAVLLVTLSVFWAVAATQLKFTGRNKIVLLACGAASMLLLPFLPTTLHDEVINCAAFLGLVAMGLIYARIYKNGWHGLFAFGLCNLLLVGLNNYVYYSPSLLQYLPVVQKITFVFLIQINNSKNTKN
jgi:hypothetical protein